MSNRSRRPCGFVPPIENCLGLPLPVVFFGEGDLGGFVEQLAQVGIVVALQQGQQLMTDAIAREAGIAIGFVFAPRLSDRREILLDLSALGFQQGRTIRTPSRKKQRDECRRVPWYRLRAGTSSGQSPPDRRRCAQWRWLRSAARGHSFDQPFVTQFAGGVLDAEFVADGVFANVSSSGKERQVVVTAPGQLRTARRRRNPRRAAGG